MYRGKDGLWREDKWNPEFKCVESFVIIKRPREYWLIATSTDTLIMTSESFANEYKKNYGNVLEIIHVKEIISTEETNHV